MPYYTGEGMENRPLQTKVFHISYSPIQEKMQPFFLSPKGEVIPMLIT